MFNLLGGKNQSTAINALKIRPYHFNNFFGFRCYAGNTSDEINITDIVKSLSKDYDNYVRPNHGGRNANKYLSTLPYLSLYLNTDIFQPFFIQMYHF